MPDAVLESKLAALRRCVERLEAKRPQTIDALLEDIDLQDIVAVNLERAIQQCVDIAARVVATRSETTPSSMAESFTSLAHLEIIDANLAQRMRKAVGLRNVAVHLYQSIDWEIVFHVLWNNLDDFRDFAARILELDSSSD